MTMHVSNFIIQTAKKDIHQYFVANKNQLMKLPPLENSQTNIRVGLQIMGKVYTNAREWTGKFAQLQNQHQYPRDTAQKSKFGQLISKNMDRLKINYDVCGLCQLEKPRSEMQLLCKCHHSYCYSCLNSYAISKIEELVPVKCPLQQCSETIQLTSNVYRYLPDSVKLKYLQNKHTFKVNKEDEANRCQRCLQPKHAGQCKYALSPDLIENSFKYRECSKCRVEIRLTRGKKKVACDRCKQQLCYLCGVAWAKNHICSQKETVRQLQRQIGYQGCCPCCCDCCSYGCQNTCTGCGDCCCRSCGNCCLEECCCSLMFYCEDPGPVCCIWNIVSIPIRILLTFLVFMLIIMLYSCVLMVVVFWVLLCLVGGALAIAGQVICDSGCPLALLLLLLFPFVFIYGFGKALAETHEVPVGMAKQLAEMCCSMLESVWVELSPKRCL